MGSRGTTSWPVSACRIDGVRRVLTDQEACPTAAREAVISSSRETHPDFWSSIGYAGLAFERGRHYGTNAAHRAKRRHNLADLWQELLRLALRRSGGDQSHKRRQARAKMGFPDRGSRQVRNY